MSRQRLNFSEILWKECRAEKTLSEVAGAVVAVVVVSWVVSGRSGSLGFFSEVFIVAVWTALVILICRSSMAVMTSLWEKGKGNKTWECATVIYGRRRTSYDIKKVRFS